MPHYHLQSLAYDWQLIRETSTSYIFRCRVADGLEAVVTIHFTPPPLATATLICAGDRDQFTKGKLNTIFEDLEHICLRRSGYELIDYTLAFTSKIDEGNYSIMKDTINSYRPNDALE